MTTRFLLRALLGPLSVVLLLFATVGAAPARDDQNTELPPLTSADLSERAAQLFEAIKTGKPELGDAFFFPREPFLTLKDVDDPGRYHAQLVSAYHHNIRDLHKSRKSWDGAELRGVELVEKPKRVPPGREWNKIGYFRTKGARMEYEIQGHRRFIEVHTVISWDGRWYVTHLAPIRR
jgi:hypothetical protein